MPVGIHKIMKIVAIDGSPRKRGNSVRLMEEFIRGALDEDKEIIEYKTSLINLKPCSGCLKCNLYKKCVLKDDDWPRISNDLLGADAIAISSPVYFHHFPGPLKSLLDRFRSFIDVDVKEDGLVHTPWQPWSKRFVLMLTLGSPLTDDAQPIIDLFAYLTEILGPDNSLEILIAPSLQMSGQISMREDQLINLYSRMGRNETWAKKDYIGNQRILKKAYESGARSD